MDFYGIYILLPDGRCIFSKVFKGDPIDPQLLGGMLSAFNMASRQWLKEGIHKFVSENGLNFVMKDFETFMVASQVSDDISIENEAKIETIGYRFMSTYADTIDKWSAGRITSFKDFEHILDDILGIETDSMQKTGKELPSILSEDQVLDSLSIVFLPKNIQKTALEMLSQKEGTVSQIADKTGNNEKAELQNLEWLLNEGYILSRKKGNDRVFYLP